LLPLLGLPRSRCASNGAHWLSGSAIEEIGPIKINGEIKDGERVFDERRSLVFKTLQVVRFFDRKRNVLVYVAYSDRIIEGSPKNSISSVPIMAWPEP